jgi:hypothetical protein
LELELSKEEQEKECHVNIVDFQKSDTVWKNDIELHWLLCFIDLLLALLIDLVVHNEWAIFCSDVVWLSVTLDVYGRWAQEEWQLVDQGQGQH